MSCLEDFMERIFDEKKVAACIAKSKYYSILSTMDVDFYLIKYEKGEFVSSPFQTESLFQIVEQGSINIYIIRDDGTRHALSSGTTFLETWISFIPGAATFTLKRLNL